MFGLFGIAITWVKALVTPFAEKVMSDTNTEPLNSELAASLLFVFELLRSHDSAVSMSGKIRQFFTDRVKETSKNDLIKLMSSVDNKQEIDLAAATKCFGTLGSEVGTIAEIQDRMDHFLHWSIRQLVAKAGD